MKAQASSAQFSPVPSGTVNLGSFHNEDFDRGASAAKEFLWLMASLIIFQLCPLKLSAFKCWLLRRFGARIGIGVVIKPKVKITFPWKLVLGDNVWLGEECWLLNLAPISIADNVCISQRAFLCCGSHDYRSPSFDLVVKPILIEAGAWIASAAFVGPGVTVGSHAILSAGSVATQNLDAYGIYRGNPARLVKNRSLPNGGAMEDAPLSKPPLARQARRLKRWRRGAQAAKERR